MSMDQKKINQIRQKNYQNFRAVVEKIILSHAIFFILLEDLFSKEDFLGEKIPLHYYQTKINLTDVRYIVQEIARLNAQSLIKVGFDISLNQIKNMAEYIIAESNFNSSFANKLREVVIFIYKEDLLEKFQGSINKLVLWIKERDNTERS
jgi:hypothetical protein